MRAGQRDRRVQLQAATITRGETGGKVETWATVATVYASVQDANGSQIFQAQAIGNKVDKMVNIRYRSGVTAAMRLVLHDGAIARINAVKLIGRNRELDLFCEVVNG